MKKLLLALLLAVGFLVSPISPVSPASASSANSYTTCAQAYNKTGIGVTFGCIDMQTGVGPVFQGWNSASGSLSPAWSFGISNGVNGMSCSNATFTAGEWQYGSTNYTLAGLWPSGNVCSGLLYTYDYNTGLGWPWMSTSQHDILEFLSNSAGYELVFINA